MSISKKLFGTFEGSDVFCYTLDNGNGLTAEILSFGGIIKNLYFEGTDIVLGRDTMESYITNNGYLGALIGRNSNRIENGEFELNGKTYRLALNDNGIANLHGGVCGFNKKIWSCKEDDSSEPSLILNLTSPDGDEGFPGEVKVTVTYTLTKDNSLKIHYNAISDADTILNMTNHSYFNLNGHSSGDMSGHTLKMDCCFYTPNTPNCYPNGEVLSCKGTAFDFSQERRLGDSFSAPDEQIKMFNGIDHNFPINGRGFRYFATLKGDKTGITMDMFTDMPAVQVYTSNMMDKNDNYKEGAPYGLHSAICFETQFFPNSMSYSHFPSIILKKGCKYDTSTEYKFSK